MRLLRGAWEHLTGVIPYGCAQGSAETPRVSAHVDDLALIVDPHFLLGAAYPARLECVPGLAELRSVLVRSRFHDEPLVAVLPAPLARVGAGDAGSTVLRDHGLSAGGA